MLLFPIYISFDKSVGNINGRVEILVSSNQNLFVALEEACQKIGIVFSESFQASINGILLDINRTIEHNEITEGSNIIVNKPGRDIQMNKNDNDYITTTTRMWKPLAIVGILFSIAGLIILITIYIINCMSLYSYSVVIDAGSTSSKIYLYSWPSNKFINNADVSQISSCKSDPGISSFEYNPNKSFDGIRTCLDNVIIQNIPTDKKSISYIYLGATAGMRMLSYKNPNATNNIMNFQRLALSEYALKINNTLTDISIISGSTEGLTGWITVNYLLNNFRKAEDPSTAVIGAMDMGGASAQVTFFDSSGTASSDTVNIRLYGKTYRVYSHSYLCYGKSQAELRFLAVLISQKNFDLNIENPCMLIGERVVFKAQDIFMEPCIYGKFAIDHYGYEIVPPKDILTNNSNFTINGTSNYDQCQSLVDSLFNQSKCLNNTNCTFNGVYQPKLSGKFGAFSAFPLIKEILNPNNENFDLPRYKKELVSKCNGTSKTTDPYEDKYAKWICFDLIFLIEILEKFGFNNSNWKDIEFLKTINNYNIGWSLGYMIEKTALLPKEQHLLPLQDYLFGILVVVLLIILLFAIGFLVLSLRSRGKRINCTDLNCDSNEEQNLLSPSRN